MIVLKTREIAALVHGHQVGPEVTVTGISADSRAVSSGELFVALRDARDGHDFLASAFANGATAALVERVEALPNGMAGIVVADTWQAIATLAGAVRTRLAPQVVAVTGSVGKTTTKDLIAAAIRSSRVTVASEGSFNNELGVPLTLLELAPDTEVAVIEVGSRGAGHIASLMGIVRPDVAVVTAVGGGAHLETFGTIEALIAAKAELVQGLGVDGVAVLNMDDDAVRSMAAAAPGAVVLFSALGSNDADVRAVDVTLDAMARASFTVHCSQGQAQVSLPLAGVQHVGNALASLAVAVHLGVDLQIAADALATAPVSQWRSELIDVHGIRVLNDAYNANPTSMVAALDALAAMDLPGRRIAVLGAMAELGPDQDDGHRRVGVHASGAVDQIIVVGAGAAGIAAAAREHGATDVIEVDDVAGAIAALHARKGDGVLVKASRVAGLERLVDAMASGVPQ
jgi:UDP-N-acetylmuramoyl-tripeptide--D-alanyl-D-alanine ligase